MQQRSSWRVVTSPFSKFCIIGLLLIGTCVLACNPTDKENMRAQWIQEIIDVEQAFNDMAQSDGLAQAFQYYAAPNGAIKRGKSVISGKRAIGRWYEQDVRPDESLSWKPTFVDVSASGDLGYTYGDFTFTQLDSAGEIKENKGIFHTVWKRQPDGNWRFVWD
ncbi:MAG: nuclear transport factor 2 family protein [Saprospiraceae bacterium]|nr:nuclear transport factor 2 family protein [Saprospiraceae bacterium]